MSIDESKLSPEQLSKKNEIEGMAALISFAVALVICIFIWFYFGKNYPYLRYLFMAVSAPISFLVAYIPSVGIMSSGAKCEKCGESFCVSQTARDEKFLSATPRRRESEVGRSVSGPNEGKRIIRKESWTEERYEVTTTYTCSACGTSKVSKSIRTSDKNKHSDDVYRR